MYEYMCGHLAFWMRKPSKNHFINAHLAKFPISRRQIKNSESFHVGDWSNSLFLSILAGLVPSIAFSVNVVVSSFLLCVTTCKYV